MLNGGKNFMFPLFLFECSDTSLNTNYNEYNISTLHLVFPSTQVYQEIALSRGFDSGKNEAHSIFSERIQRSSHRKPWIKFSHTSIHEFPKTFIPFPPSKTFTSSHSCSPPANRPTNTKQ